MAVRVAEYLGKRTDKSKIIKPLDPHYSSLKKSNSVPLCPFMNKECSKVTQNNKPVCSVRTSKGDLWIVCKNRLSATYKTIPLHDHQKRILFEIAQTVFGDHIRLENVLVDREVDLSPKKSKSRSSADYVMLLHGANSKSGPNKVVLEMQGGGETSNTGLITQMVDEWEKKGIGQSNELNKPVTGAGTIVTNAWRRQQEQFLIKGNVAHQSGAGLVFCVGTLLYHELSNKVKTAGLIDLKDHNWSLALIGIKEDKANTNSNGSIPLTVDREKMLFTDYHSFARALTVQGEPKPEAFRGEFISLDDKTISIG